MSVITIRMQATFARWRHFSTFLSHNVLVVASHSVPVVRGGQKLLMRGVSVLAATEKRFTN